MSEHPSFDRAKGFVALPVEVLEIDLSPGAFRLLVELCRMANADGFCWPSLDQLSTRMGRSKAAISGYIKALRDADLVSTETQKTANGYNYRLKYRVTFWQDWRASLAGSARQKPERSVQPIERLKKTQKQSHINQVPAPAGNDINQLLKKWARCFKGAPYPLTSQQPTLEMLDRTANVIESNLSVKIISADINDPLTALWASLGVDMLGSDIAEQTKEIAILQLTPDEFARFQSVLPHHWQPHWKRPPTIEQFKKLLLSAVGSTSHQQITLLKSYQKRWEMAQNSLRPRSNFGSVAPNKQAAA